jgi:hypothetical protein
MLVCRRANVLARFVKHTFTMNLPRNILVPVDLGEQTESVLDYAVALAASSTPRSTCFTCSADRCSVRKPASL